ncbi:hypothetical protein BOX15_Mlig015180g1 [Macrostomum lignano]|uniref:Shugoshin C-terminal domain-containing protein n=1 Tax=Macrostomum lignano TaxID=282301 RepID=A0A267GY94_9PLAT|nr:hypothetical protein BOX15_Mlig015180g1 [Macrostomum lignano]
MPLASAALKHRTQYHGGASARPGSTGRAIAGASNLARPVRDEGLKENRIAPLMSCNAAAAGKEKALQAQQKLAHDQVASLTARVKQLELENSSLRRCLANVNNCRAMFMEVHSQAILSLEHLSKCVQLSQSALDELALAAPPTKDAAAAESRLPVATAAATVSQDLQPQSTTTTTTQSSGESGAAVPKSTTAVLKSRRTVVIEPAPGLAASTESSSESLVIKQQLSRQLTPLMECSEAAGRASLNCSARGSLPNDQVVFLGQDKPQQQHQDKPQQQQQDKPQQQHQDKPQQQQQDKPQQQQQDKTQQQQQDKPQQQHQDKPQQQQQDKPQQQQDNLQQQQLNQSNQSRHEKSRHSLPHESMEVQQELNQLPEIPAEQNKPAAGLQRKALKPQPKQRRRPQRRSQFVRNQEQKSPVHQRSAEELQNPTENPFIPRHRLARTPPKCGADTSAAASCNGNATFDQLPPLSPPSPQPPSEPRPATLSPTSSLKLIGKQLAPSIQQTRPVANRAAGSHQRRGTFVINQPPRSTATTSPPSPPLPPSPPAIVLDVRHALVLSPPPHPRLSTLPDQPDFAELPDWPDTARASVSTVTGDAAACSLTAKVLTRELRVAPRPSLLPKPLLSPPSAAKTSAPRRSSLMAPPAAAADEALAAAADEAPAAKRHRRKQSSTATTVASAESSAACADLTGEAAAVNLSAPLRPRRQRAAAVNYKEPSVNTKLRRCDK